jgi:uncharacterized protein (UPF0261 family)
MAFAVVQHLPRPIFHGTGGTAAEAIADANQFNVTLCDCCDTDTCQYPDDSRCTKIYAITDQLAEVIRLDGGDINECAIELLDRMSGSPATYHRSPTSSETDMSY